MAAIRLTTENVRIILGKLLDDCGYWEFEGKDAEKLLCYIAGLTDMAKAVMTAIVEFGGK